MKTSCPSRFFVAALTLAITFQVSGDSYFETGDAGTTESTAQFLPSGTEEVGGTLKAGTDNPFGTTPVDVDVYHFYMNQAVTGAKISVNTGEFDSNLLLLGEGFFGLWGDDDSGVDLGASITVDLVPGNYYIAVGINNIGAYPFDAMSTADAAWDNSSGQLDPVTAAIPIEFIGTTDSSPEYTDGEYYNIAFENFTTGAEGEEAGGVTKEILKSVLVRRIAKLKKKLRKAKGKKNSSAIRKLKKKLKRATRKLNQLG